MGTDERAAIVARRPCEHQEGMVIKDCKSAEKIERLDWVQKAVTTGQLKDSNYSRAAEGQALIL